MTLPAAKTAEEDAREDMLPFFFYQYSLSEMERREMTMNANVVPLVSFFLVSSASVRALRAFLCRHRRRFFKG
jgi:hypothetical protein